MDELLAEATDASPAESQSEFDVDDLLAEPADAPPAEPQPELDVDDSLVEPATPAQQAEPDMDELVSALTGGTQPAAAAGEVDTDTGRPRIRLAKADTRPELSPGLRLLIQVALVVALTGVAAVVAWMLRQ